MVFHSIYDALVITYFLTKKEGKKRDVLSVVVAFNILMLIFSASLLIGPTFLIQIAITFPVLMIAVFLFGTLILIFEVYSKIHPITQRNRWIFRDQVIYGHSIIMFCVFLYGIATVLTFSNGSVRFSSIHLFIN